MKNKKGFTLVELLAVIVILAVILIIAVPRISDVIKNSKKASFEASAKTIISQAEKKKMENEVLDNTNSINCEDIVNISNGDYEKCELNFDASGNAKISIIGKGKFTGLKIVNGTKDNLNVLEVKPPEYGVATDYISNLYSYDAESNNLKKDNTVDANIRYYGENPNNYVSFNNELWRIIGVFDNNVKLIRNESLGQLSWDSSNSSINNGSGVNEWSEADLEEYLNTMYYGGTTVACYKAKFNATTTCPTGFLNNTAKSMIDNHTWATGAPNIYDLNDSVTKTMDTISFYNAERGMQTGKKCSSGNYCNDTVLRTTSWTGYIALPYVTDYVYASKEDDCNTKIDRSTTYKCKNNNWMHDNSDSIWTISPYIDSLSSSYVWIISLSGMIKDETAYNFRALYPSLYLKSDVKVTSGTGTSSDPYKLEI